MNTTPDDSCADDIHWPTAIKTSDRVPEATALVFAWKPIINGWDIVPGRQVAESPSIYTYWLPMMPCPE